MADSDELKDNATKQLDNTKLCETIKANYGKMKARFLQFAEELKMRRENDKENEEKVNKLITEKFELKKSKEEEISQLNAVVDGLKQELLQMQKGFDEKLKFFEEEKKVQNMSITSSSKGISSLKDEILALQLSKFALEKKTKDLEHQIQIESRGKIETMNKMKEIEKSSESMLHQFNELVSRLEHLANLVIKTEEMHQKLVQVNEHQQCIISTQHKDLLNCQQELLDTKSSLKLQEQKLKQKEDHDSIERDNKQLEIAIKGGMNSLQLQLEKELESTREQKKFLMTSLSESNRQLASVQRKYESSNDFNCSLQLEFDEAIMEKTKLDQEMKEIKEKLKLLEDRLDGEIKNKEELIEKFNTESKSHEVQLSLLQLAFDKLQIDYQSLMLENETLVKVSAKLEQQLSISKTQNSSISHDKEENALINNRKDTLHGTENSNIYGGNDGNQNKIAPGSASKQTFPENLSKGNREFFSRSFIHHEEKSHEHSEQIFHSQPLANNFMESSEHQAIFASQP